MTKILFIMLLLTTFSLKAQTKKEVESTVTRVYFSIIESQQQSVGT